MAGIIITGIVCFFVGGFFGMLCMALMAATKEREQPPRPRTLYKRTRTMRYVDDEIARYLSSDEKIQFAKRDKHEE